MFARRVRVTVCDRANAPPPHHHQTTPSRQQDKIQNKGTKTRHKDERVKAKSDDHLLFRGEIETKSEASLNHGLLTPL